MSVDQYYSWLLDKYDIELSYHKKIDEEENIEERFRSMYIAKLCKTYESFVCRSIRTILYSGGTGIY